jgi:AcrR family transcriptional regulator
MARRSVADAAATRENILTAARTMFAAQGYTASAARDIAAAAGVTMGALFHHFGTKAGLFRAVFEQMVVELNTAALASFAALDPDKPLDAMIGSMRVALSFAEKPDFHQIVTVDGPVVLGAEEWRKIDARLGYATVRGGLAMLQEKGLVERQPLDPLAVLVMGAMNNAGFALARGQKNVDVEGLLSVFRRMIEGLAPR